MWCVYLYAAGRGCQHNTEQHCEGEEDMALFLAQTFSQPDSVYVPQNLISYARPTVLKGSCLTFAFVCLSVCVL